MVLAYWGVEVDESELYKCCGSDFLGTTARSAADCASTYGFVTQAIRNAAWSDLEMWLSKNIYPILFVNLFPIDSLWVYHAVIVEAINEETVQFLDPAQGRRQAHLMAFEQAWQMNKQQAILITNIAITEI